MTYPLQTQRRSKLRKLLCAAAMALACSATSALADTVYWTGAANNTEWHNGGNWSSNSVPTGSDHVVFDGKTADIGLSQAVTVHQMTVTNSDIALNYAGNGLGNMLNGISIDATGPFAPEFAVMAVLTGTLTSPAAGLAIGTNLNLTNLHKTNLKLNTTEYNWHWEARGCVCDAGGNVVEWNAEGPDLAICLVREPID